MKKNHVNIRNAADKVTVGLYFLLAAFLFVPGVLRAAAQPATTGVQHADSRVSLNERNALLTTILSAIKDQTGLAYGFRDSRSEVSGERFSIRVTDVAVEEALDALFRDSRYTYEITAGLILVSQRQEQPKAATVSGTVRDEKGEPLPGVTVIIKGTTVGTATDMDGRYSMTLPGNGENIVLVYSFVGMEVKEVAYTGQPEINVVLKPAMEEMEEVVVTGMFTRKANTFSGSVTTMKKEELQRVGNTNILQSLKHIDPSFMQIENLASGSNPNALPDYQMRGSSTIADVQGEYASSANQPLFILDGFETELTKILDLDMNQVESLTLLKDATAKAIYGSKAANGVVVIETVRPQSGRLKVTYTGSLNIETPDLSSYDLCDAWDKLEVERRAGLFRDNDGNAENQIALDKVYTSKLNEVLKGANTDWKAQPTRVGVGHKHSLYLEGGDNAMLYGIDLSYNNIEGVMKGSNRNTFSGGITLSYRIKDLIFRNKLTIDYNDSNESPYGT
ncbi:MAG: carboxypeptidase-like regulatory domain-containing protein, partial [Odoribacter sp.]|nr:carboxypeptidase-like regulatory domain-containing protein [Odoribacter sp.]